MFSIFSMISAFPMFSMFFHLGWQDGAICRALSVFSIHYCRYPYSSSTIIKTYFIKHAPLPLSQYFCNIEYEKCKTQDTRALSNRIPQHLHTPYSSPTTINKCFINPAPPPLSHGHSSFDRSQKLARLLSLRDVVGGKGTARGC